MFMHMAQLPAQHRAVMDSRAKKFIYAVGGLECDGYDDPRPRNPKKKMPRARPTHNPIAISCRTSGPRSPARCGLSRLFTNGGMPIAKIAREKSMVRFLRMPGLASMI